MNVLFNCSTNIVGGGLKNSALFIKSALSDSLFNWHFAVSQPVYHLLQQWGLSLPNDIFTVFQQSPARNRHVRRTLVQLTIDVKADFVYTMAGPAYVSFPCKHVMGISNAYITHADVEAYKLKGNWLKVLRYLAYTSLQFLYAYKADYYVFQTQYAKESFQKRSLINADRLFVIPNAYDNLLRKQLQRNENNLNKVAPQTIKIFCPGANYIHKGFQFIPEIISEIIKLTSQRFEFILTLPQDSDLWKQIKEKLKTKNITAYCINSGPYIYTELVSLLESSDILFVPSLLETFSASYLEAMCAEKKLLVANKPFAKDICQDYAIYTNPVNSKETALKIINIFNSLRLSQAEINLGDRILNQYGDQNDRYNNITNLLRNLLTE